MPQTPLSSTLLRIETSNGQSTQQLPGWLSPTLRVGKEFRSSPSMILLWTQARYQGYRIHKQRRARQDRSRERDPRSSTPPRQYAESWFSPQCRSIGHDQCHMNARRAWRRRICPRRSADSAHVLKCRLIHPELLICVASAAVLDEGIVSYG